MKCRLSHTNTLPRGITLIDVVVGTAIITIVFLGIFGAFKLSIELVYNTKAKTGAVSLVTQQMEFIRSLQYDAVGTVGGIPSGAIPQLSQESLNGVLYTVRTFIQYEDAPEDGLDVLDENGITADYKVIKVEVLWTTRGFSRSAIAVSRVAPRGIESIAGGGTLRINVINSVALPISGASVHIVNSGVAPAVDVTASTNANGSVIFPGAPSASGYEITVSKDDYSGAQTYDSSAGNPNPNPGHVAVAEGTTSTISFSIDLLASLRTFTKKAIGPGMFSDAFDDTSQLFSTSSVSVQEGALTLLDSEGSYAPEGSGTSISINPQYLSSWDAFSWDSTTPPSTAFLTHVYYFDGSGFSLVPDADLPGNSTGFNSSPVDLTSLPTATYDQLRVGASLSTGDLAVTPSLLSWDLSYHAGPTPLPSIPFGIRGTKTIGTDGSGIPIYKVDATYTTDQYGEWLVDPLDPDAYLVTVSAPTYNVVERCPFDLSVLPNSGTELTITLDTKTTHSLLVNVIGNNTPIQNATVVLTGPKSGNQPTSACGQTYFGGLTNDLYTVSITAPGFLAHNEDVAVSGATVFSVSLPGQ